MRLASVVLQERTTFTKMCNHAHSTYVCQENLRVIKICLLIQCSRENGQLTGKYSDATDLNALSCQHTIKR